MSHTFIKKTDFNTGLVSFFAVSANTIETLAISDTFGAYGQQISAADAGDSITLLTQAAVDAANAAYANFHSEESSSKWSLNDYISAYDYSQ